MRSARSVDPAHSGWRALPASGRLISLEIEEKHAAVAQRSLAASGVAVKVEVRLGPAGETL